MWNGDAAFVEDDGEGELAGLRIEAEAESELESEIGVAVKNDALLANLVESQRTRGHRCDEHLIDDRDRHFLRHDVEDRRCADGHAQIRERVIAWLRQRRNHEKERVGACPQRLLRQMHRCAQPGSAELSFDREVAAEEPCHFGGQEIGCAAADADANAGGRVLRNGDAGWIGDGGETGQMELELTKLTKGCLCGGAGRK